MTFFEAKVTGQKIKRSNSTSWLMFEPITNHLLDEKGQMYMLSSTDIIANDWVSQEKEAKASSLSLDVNDILAA